MYIQVQPDACCLGAPISLSGGRECTLSTSTPSIIMHTAPIIVRGGSIMCPYSLAQLAQVPMIHI